MSAAPTEYPIPTVLWHGPDAGHAGQFLVIVRHGDRITHHRRLDESQYRALIESPALARPAAPGPSVAERLAKAPGNQKGGRK